MGMIGQLQVEPGRLIVTPHPMLLDGQRNVVWEARAGESLYAILQRNVPELDGQRWDVCIGGRAVERHLWHHVYPKQGQVIEVRGGVGRSALALVAVLALTYFTFGFGAATAGMWGAGAVAGAPLADHRRQRQGARGAHAGGFVVDRFQLRFPGPAAATDGAVTIRRLPDAVHGRMRAGDGRERGRIAPFLAAAYGRIRRAIGGRHRPCGLS